MIEWLSESIDKLLRSSYNFMFVIYFVWGLFKIPTYKSNESTSNRMQTSEGKI